MEERHLVTMTLLLVLAAGFMGVVGMTNMHSGALVQEVRGTTSRTCYCEIQHYDFYGNYAGSEIHTIRVQTSQQHTDSSCYNRCDALFGKGGRKAILRASATPILGLRR